MDFKDILEQWESSPEGQKAVEEGRFSHVLKEKEEGFHEKAHPGVRADFPTGRAALGYFKNLETQESLDLHGRTSDEAQRLVEEFLKESYRQRLVKVRIVHGRGLHSPDGRAVLKDVVMRILKRSPLVRATGVASPSEGGSGAVWVILQRGKSEPVSR
jgi:DNA-nicking Smr family endonuclease